MDNKKILKLIDEALDAAHTAGMEDAAEMEGVSWTGTSSKVEAAKADAARRRLLMALEIPVELPVYDKIGGGSKVGSAVVDKDGTATITLDDSPEAKAIRDKILNPPCYGISSKGTKK